MFGECGTSVMTPFVLTPSGSCHTCAGRQSTPVRHTREPADTIACCLHLALRRSGGTTRLTLLV